MIVRIGLTIIGLFAGVGVVAVTDYVEGGVDETARIIEDTGRGLGWTAIAIVAVSVAYISK